MDTQVNSCSQRRWSHSIVFLYSRWEKLSSSDTFPDVRCRTIENDPEKRWLSAYSSPHPIVVHMSWWYEPPFSFLSVFIYYKRSAWPLLRIIIIIINHSTWYSVFERTRSFLSLLRSWNIGNRLRQWFGTYGSSLILQICQRTHSTCLSMKLRIKWIITLNILRG